MIITPDNEAYLLKAPLEIDELQQIDFANATAQANYFQSLPKLALMKVTYIRENGAIAVPFNIEQIRSYNYVMYKNKNYGDKWFYAFITGMNYEGNTVTTVGIKTDVFQTYMFDYTWKQSYVKRETVADDTFGKHLLPEDVDTGDFVMNKSNVLEYEICTSKLQENVTNDTPLIAVVCSEKVGKLTATNDWSALPLEDLHITGSIPDGSFVYFFYNTISDYANFIRFRVYLDSIGKGEAITNMFLVPQKVVATELCYIFMYDAEGHLDHDTGFTIRHVSSDTYGMKNIANVILQKPTKIGNFTPKNQKTLTYPFNYFVVSNHVGEDVPFHYEDFEGNNPNPTFVVEGTFSQLSSYICRPFNSRKSYTPTSVTEKLNAECIRGAPLPPLSWSNDFYLNWIAQNGRRIEYKKLQAGLDIVKTPVQGFAESFSGQTEALASGATGTAVASGIVGASTGFVSSVNNYVDTLWNIREDKRVADLVPDTLKGNANNGDLTFSSNSNGFGFYNYHVREEIAQKIDNYFSVYGYRVNEFKTPNTKTRSKWNFLQTSVANLTGDIPQEAIMELKNMYNAGITIWHDPAHFLDYTQSNTIV